MTEELSLRPQGDTCSADNGEYRFLLSCIRTALSANAAPGPHSIRPDADMNWVRLCALAQHHEVVPLLSAAFAQDPSWVPAPVINWLKLRSKATVARNLSLASELLELLSLFRINGVTAIPFKGPALAVAAYGNLSLRQIGDLDIFVGREQVKDAVRLMQGRGYAVTERFSRMSDEELYFWHKDISLCHPACDVHVELHWSACEPSFDSLLASRASTRPLSSTTLLGGSVPIPGREELLLLLSLHGLRHRWECLKWIADLAALIANPGIDWDAALAEAEQLARVRMVLLALALTRELFEVTLPASVAQRIDRDFAVRRMMRQICARLAIQSTGDAELSHREAVLSRTHFYFLRVQTRDRLADRMNLFARIMIDRAVPNAEDRNFLPLPGILRIFYWVIRPFRLVFQYGPLCMLQLTRRLLGALSGSG